jgi:NADPH2:quinone reductase
MASGTAVPLDPVDMLLRNYAAVGVLAMPGDPGAEAAAWDRLRELAVQGEVSTPVGSIYRFADVPRMVAEQTAPGPGKTVVRVTSR